MAVLSDVVYSTVTVSADVAVSVTGNTASGVLPLLPSVTSMLPISISGSGSAALTICKLRVLMLAIATSNVAPAMRMAMATRISCFRFDRILFRLRWIDFLMVLAVIALLM